MHIGSTTGLARSELLSVQYRGYKARPNALPVKPTQVETSTPQQSISPARFKAEFGHKINQNQNQYQKPTVEVIEQSPKAKRALEGYLDNGEFSLYPGASNLAGIDLHV